MASVPVPLDLVEGAVGGVDASLGFQQGVEGVVVTGVMLFKEIGEVARIRDKMVGLVGRLLIGTGRM